jgi:tetratricopeptide (TPR) repeat protein
MTLSARLFQGVLAILLCASLGGCLDSARSQLEEEKESHYIAGKTCLNSMDYRGAIEEFEKALRINPDSASAQIQLGCLYEEKEPDPAAAIYHYQQFLKLRPHADNAEWIQQRIANCKQDLAKTVLLPMTPGVQHQLEQLTEEKKRLQEELDRYKAAYNASRPSTTDSSAPASARPGQTVAMVQGPSSAGLVDRLTGTGTGAGSRTHTVQSGDVPYSIARKYGVKLEALMAANPGLEARRLRIGQTVTIPVP